MNETCVNLLIRTIQETSRTLVSLAVLLMTASNKYGGLTELERTDKAYDFLIKMFKHGKEYKELFADAG